MEFDFLASRSIKLYTLSCWIEGEAVDRQVIRRPAAYRGKQIEVKGSCLRSKVKSQLTLTMKLSMLEQRMCEIVVIVKRRY